MLHKVQASPSLPGQRTATFSVTAIAVIVTLGTLAYSNSLQVPFVFDDLDAVADNPHVQITSLSWAELRDAAVKSKSSRRPLANLSFSLNYYAGRLRTTGYHGVNLAIHLACGVLVYFLGRATFTRANELSSQVRRPAATEWMALTAALVFVCHPVQVQAVTYIVQRMTSLATLLYLAALLLYIRGRIAVTPRRWVLWGAATICWLGSLGSKEIAITWPVAVLIYEWFFFQDLSRNWLRACGKAAVPIIGLLAFACVLTYGTQLKETLFGGYSSRDFTMGERVLTEFRVLAFYLSLLVWPSPNRLCLTHEFTISHSLFDPITTLLSLLLLVGVLILAMKIARKFRVASYCVLWFFLQLALESSVLPLELTYEHRLYLPMVGVAMLASWGLFALLPNRAQALVVACPVIMLLAVSTHARNDTWRDAATLWTDVVAKYPNDPRALNNLGRVLAEKGDFNSALSHLQRALEKDPDYPEAHYNIGVTRAMQGDLADAMENYRKAIAADPTYFPAYNNLGALLASEGKEFEAIDLFERALKINPDFAPAHNNLGNVFASQGKSAAAVQHYRRALELDSRIPDAHLGLGSLLTSSGDYAEAEQHYRQALRLAKAQGQESFARRVEAALKSLPSSSP